MVSSIDDDPDNFERVLEVGNDEGVLSEETEVSVGTPFRGAQLYKWR